MASSGELGTVDGVSAGGDSAVQFFPGQNIIEIDAALIEQLKRRADAAPLRRARLCLHQTHADPIQEMIIAFCKDSYNAPLRHLGKSESIDVLDGELAIVFFAEDGSVTRRVRMGPPQSGLPFLLRIYGGMWYTVVPLTEHVVTHECIEGPFNRDHTDVPPWAPRAPHHDGVEAFVQRILTEVPRGPKG